MTGRSALLVDDGTYIAHITSYVSDDRLCSTKSTASPASVRCAGLPNRSELRLQGHTNRDSWEPYITI